MQIINQDLQTTKIGGDDVNVPHIFIELGDHEQTSKVEKYKQVGDAKWQELCNFLGRQKHF